jgi:S-adenosylmethionine/arginine decarboxylase-like enzyme
MAMISRAKFEEIYRLSRERECIACTVDDCYGCDNALTPDMDYLYKQLKQAIESEGKK